MTADVEQDEHKIPAPLRQRSPVQIAVTGEKEPSFRDVFLERTGKMLVDKEEVLSHEYEYVSLI